MMKLPEPLTNLLKRFVPLPYVVHPTRGAGMVDGRVVVYADRQASVSDQFNILRANICALSSESPIKTILITSSQTREGKTITSCNLAYSLSMDKEKKTLLVDANLRRPAVHSMFGIPQGPGFADLMDGKASIETLTAKPAVENLYIIPGGELISDPVALLRPANIEPLINGAKAGFDYIVIDTPNVHDYSDAGIIGSFCDAVFLVIKAKATQEDIIDEAFNRLTEARSRPKGCIVTNVSESGRTRHSRSKYKHLYLTQGS